jgi:acyl-CoA thioester hydrolase
MSGAELAARSSAKAIRSASSAVSGSFNSKSCTVPFDVPARGALGRYANKLVSDAASQLLGGCKGTVRTSDRIRFRQPLSVKLTRGKRACNQHRTASHRFPLDIESGDIDFMGHVNNASYLKWVQAAVLDNWNALAPAEVAAKHLWVALKHEITYLKPAFLEDDVFATVILERVQGARAFYETVIRRREEVLAEVKSSRCCIDAETRRPARIARDIVQRFLPSPASETAR